MTTVTIVQPYVPKYRVPFFEGLTAELARTDIILDVVSGAPTGDQLLRRDTTSPHWLTTVQPRVVSIGRRSLTLTRTREFWRDSDAVILPHMGSSVDAWEALLTTKKIQRVGLWGHIKSYIASPNPLDARLESLQLRLSDHVFAYTQGGSQYASSNGVPDSRITTVMNTVDTKELQSLKGPESRDPRLLQLEENHGTTRTYFSYIGALDSSKRIDLLAESLEIVWTEDPSIHVLVGGEGRDAAILEPAIHRGQVTRLGYVDARAKVHMASLSKALVVPGRIGLIAVEALALRLPILTTSWPYHAPEVEYLTEGQTMTTSLESADDFAKLILASAHDGKKRPDEFPAPPRMSEMVNNFAHGVRTLVQQG